MHLNLQKTVYMLSKYFLYGFIVQMLVFNLGLATTVKGQYKSIDQVKVRINQESITLEEFFKSIEKQTSFNFLYDDNQINSEIVFKIKNHNGTVESFLRQISYQSNLRFRQVNNGIDVKENSNLPYVTISKQQEGIEIRGTVLDESGAPLPGVTIIIQGTTKGTVSDVDGKFSFDAEEGAVLVLSFIGFEGQTVEIGNQSEIQITMVESHSDLDEVVVIGYGTAKKKDLTGAIASVNMEDLDKLPNINAAQSIRGTVAGVTVTDNGRPGENQSIIIRGTNSISASNAPLIVLDGIIYRGGTLNDIAPGDIESINILKDASSTAVYGSLAANGVIEITTKKGTSKDPLISLNSYFGGADFAYLPDYLNAEQYLAQRKDAEAAVGGSLPFQPIELENIAAGKSINPFEAISQSAPIFNLDLSVSEKTDGLTYRISGSYLDSHSPVLGDNFTRKSMRLNLDVPVKDWLNMGMNIGYTTKKQEDYRADLASATFMSPYASLYYDDGIPRPRPMDIGLVNNPIFNTLWNDIEFTDKVLFANGYADIFLPIEGLTYRLNIGTNQVNSTRYNYSRSFDRDGITFNSQGGKSTTNRNSLTLENILKYQKVINKHTLNATALYGFYEYDDELSELSGTNMPNDALGWNALEIAEAYTINTDAGKDQQLSMMGRVGYIFDERYIIDASIRRDGYSAFGEGNKFGVFPSVGTSWNISNERFMSSIESVSNLKLRVSWGKNGNRGVSRYSSLSNMTDTYYVFNNSTVVGLYSTSMANPKLGWETTTSTNMALDFGFFNNRIAGSFDFYRSNTTDLLLNQFIPTTNGYDRFLTNVGEVSNHGIEFSLHTINLEFNEFQWATDLAFTRNKNEILKLTGADLDGDGVEDDNIASGWFIGESLGANYDYVFDGIWQEGEDNTLMPEAKAGDIKFRDVSGPEGVPDGVITPDDRKVLHNDRPDYTLGITNTFSYKGIVLSAVFTYRHGGFSRNIGVNPGNNFYDQANYMDVPYWTPENPLNTHPAINYTNPYNYGFYETRSYGRLQDVSLSYSLPENVMTKIGLNSLVIYASGKNLATWTKWTGWDPEYGAGARTPNNFGPLMKIYTLGLKVQL